MSTVPRKFTFAAQATVLAVIVIIQSVGFSNESSAATQPDPNKPTIVLVHGAWADASGWSEVIKKLQKEGYPTLAVGNPLRSLEGDSAYLSSVLAQIEGDVVLVGHSYGAGQ